MKKRAPGSLGDLLGIDNYPVIEGLFINLYNL